MPSGPTARPYALEVVTPTGRCGTGNRLFPAANSLKEAQGCAEREGFATAPVEQLQRYEWRSGGGVDCISGDFWSTPEHAQSCANVRCGCARAELARACD